MLTTMFALSMAWAAPITEQIGHDEFGRRCALRFEPRLAVMIEDEWFVVKGSATTHGGRVGATVVSKADGQPADLELDLRNGRGAYFTLRIESATGYAHGCLLELE